MSGPLHPGVDRFGLASSAHPRSPPPFRQQLARCVAPDGARIAFATAGHGPVLVKASNALSHLHFDAHSATWGHAIAELCSDHTVVRHDRRGCGLSEREVRACRFDDWVADLEAVVDAAGHGRFALLGMSDGAPIALAYAARHPTRVSRLVLHGAWARPGGRVAWPDGRDAAAEDLPESAASTAMLRRMRDEAQRVDLSPWLAQVRCPTLVLHAVDDPEVPLAEASWLVDQLADASLVPLASEHHLLPATEPAWSDWLRAVRTFLPPAPDAWTPLAHLTARERDIADLLAQGRDNAAIAEALGLEAKTVRNHVSSVYRKLGTAGRARTAVALRQGGLGTTFRPGTAA